MTTQQWYIDDKNIKHQQQTTRTKNSNNNNKNNEQQEQKTEIITIKTITRITTRMMTVPQQKRRCRNNDGSYNGIA